MTFTFEYEVEPLGQSMTVTVSHTPSSFPGDPGPDGEGEIEVESVTLNDCDVDTDGIKVARMVLHTTLSYRPGGRTKERRLPKWFTLTELIREAAWEQVERETA